MAMRRTVKRAIDACFVALVAPLAILCALEAMHGGDAIFITLAQACALVPGLPGVFVRRAFYRYEVRVEELLARSFPVPGGADNFRRVVEGDIGRDALGIGAARRNGDLTFAFPIVIASGVR